MTDKEKALNLLKQCLEKIEYYNEGEPDVDKAAHEYSGELQGAVEAIENGDDDWLELFEDTGMTFSDKLADSYRGF